MILLTTALVCLLSFLSILPLSLAAFDKPIINPAFKDGLSSLNAGLVAHLRFPGAVQWTNNLVPKWCKDTAAAQKVDVSKLHVYSVKYNDCETSWTICHHGESPSTMRTIVYGFGRVPVQLRSFVRYIASFPGGNWAYSDTNNIVLFGTTPESLSVWIHEVGHCVDYKGYSEGSPFSGTATWLNAYKGDKAVADSYSEVSQMENHSQGLAIALYDKHVLGDIKSANRGWRQIRKQYRTIQSRLGNELLSEGSCDAKLMHDAKVKVAIDEATSEPKTSENAPHHIDTSDDRGNFIGIKE